MRPNTFFSASALIITNQRGIDRAASAGVQGVQIVYPQGSGAVCPGNVVRKSILNIMCSPTAGDGVIDSISESSAPPCYFTIRFVLLSLSVRRKNSRDIQ